MTLQELLKAVTECRDAFDQRCAEASDVRALEAVRVAFMGRKGQLAGVRAKITTQQGEARKQFGAAVNELQRSIELQINTQRRDLQRTAIEAKLREERADIDLPVIDRDESGALHPVTLLRQKLQDIFSKLGFSVLEGPDIDYEDFNFNKLNIPEHHPARDMQDTFYLESKERLLLRTHTSNVQVHAMSEHRPPLRVISMGRCFRCDFDLTHTPMFHQIEGFVVDEAISFAHLKGTIDTFLRALYGDGLRTRVRPSYFPFVEPGAEVDIGCVVCDAQERGSGKESSEAGSGKESPRAQRELESGKESPRAQRELESGKESPRAQRELESGKESPRAQRELESGKESPRAQRELESGKESPRAQRVGCRVCKHSSWLEVGGCGMIHPNVFEALDIDSERYSGFAFGFGLDRMAMLYYGINDVRTLFAAPPEFNARLPIFA